MAPGIAPVLYSGRKEGKDPKAWKSIPSSVMTGVETSFTLQLEFLGPALSRQMATPSTTGCGWELHLPATAKHPCLSRQPDLPST